MNDRLTAVNSETQVNTGEVKPLEAENRTGMDEELRLLRRPRSKRYIKAFKANISNTESDTELKTEVEKIPVKNKLLGILSECGIPGCVIHSVDKFGNIIAHFRTEEEIKPELKEGYRVWREYPGCIAVEVYTHTFCIIYDDGNVKFIERQDDGI